MFAFTLFGNFGMVRKRVVKQIPVAVLACAVLAGFGMWRWHQPLSVAAVIFGLSLVVVLGVAAVALVVPDSPIGRSFGDWFTAQDDDE